MDTTNATQLAILDTASRLFSQHGWIRVSIGEICDEAAISRVSFYRYYKNKIELLKAIINLQHQKIETHYADILLNAKTIEDVVQGIFTFQESALNQFFSAPILKDIDNNKNEELARFFQENRETKYQFLNHFFGELQEKCIIHSNYPIALIYEYLKTLDDLMDSEKVQGIYGGQKADLRKSILKLIMFGLSGPK